MGSNSYDGASAKGTNWLQCGANPFFLRSSHVLKEKIKRSHKSCFSL